MDVSEVMDILAILAGLFGTLLNVLLFWVICRNQSIDQKCALLYKNLAAVDIINCIVIPICYFTISGHGYNGLKNHTNSILYLLFGGTVNIPYTILILLSVARVMIFKYQMSYKRRVRLLYVRILCVACWVLAIGTGAGIWVCFLLAGTVNFDVLIGLMRVQSIVTQILIIACIALIITSLFLLHKLIYKANEKDYTDPRAALEASITESQFLRKNTMLVKELSSARRTFIYFLVSVIVWSSYPFAFSVSFSLCGPYYNSTATQCELLQTKGLADPKISYALDLLFLCGMSIANSIILLRQKSFKNVILDLWVFFLATSSVIGPAQEQEQQPIQQAHPLPGGGQIKADQMNKAGALAIPSTLRSTDNDEVPETMHSYGTIN